LASVIRGLGESSFVVDLVSFLKTQVNFDSSIIMAYPEDGPLLILHHDLISGDRNVVRSEYSEAVSPISQFYLKASVGFRGPFYGKGSPQVSEQLSSVYTDYWRRSGTADQFAYIAQLSGGTPLILCLRRTAELSMYSENEVRSLNSYAELVITLMEKHWKDGLESISSATNLVYQSSEVVLNGLPSSCLTPRERDVLELLIKGLSNKLIARELGISHETVKVYCKNLYAKIGVSGRPAIYAKIFRSLSGKPARTGVPV